MCIGLCVEENITDILKAGGGPIESVEEWCFLGNVILKDGSCDQEIKSRSGKTNTTFVRSTNFIDE